jgi:fructose-1,6-bisphosphatase/inositol monophosphatase family enzyme
MKVLSNPQRIIDRLRELQRQIRQTLLDARSQSNLHAVHRTSSADTIFEIDVLIEPVIVEFCEEWSRELPMVVIAEGIEPETGRTFPAGISEDQAQVRIIMDPIDGTRGLMYDKRSAWSLAGVAPNQGPATRLSDIQIAVMTELPTSKMAWSDVLWSIKGQGAHGDREPLYPELITKRSSLPLSPSQAQSVDHGFAMVSNFFPGCKVIAGELTEFLAEKLLGKDFAARAEPFDDQYISTGGQFYELIVGHDRFNADLRPLFYKLQGRAGLACHAYDACTALIAQEAGVIVTDGLGQPLDGPLDVTTGLSWAIYANPRLQQTIEPLLQAFFHSRGLR